MYCLDARELRLLKFIFVQFLSVGEINEELFIFSLFYAADASSDIIMSGLG
jgi:hypothetical protein